MSKAAKKTVTNARALKKLGLIDYDLRKPLTESQKRTINSRAKKFDDVIKHPDQYFKLKAEKRGAAIKAGQSDLKTYKNNIFVPKRGAKSAKIVDDRIYTKVTNKITKEVKTERLYLSMRRDIHAQIERLQGETQPPGSYLMVRIGNNSPFGRSLDAKSLNNYVSNWVTDDLIDHERGRYKGKKSHAELVEEKNNLITQMYVVSYKFNKKKNIKRK